MITAQLADFENIHKKQTCIICGNGPTLKNMPRELLKRYPTFGTNRVYLLPGFTPTYYVAVNPLVIKQSMDEINKMKCRAKFLRAEYAKQTKDAYPLRRIVAPIFSKDIVDGIYEGYTVTFTCLQIAYYMGFTTALLVGVKHSYKHPPETRPNQEIISEGPDPNHFSPDYFGKGVRWHAADLERSRLAYILAKIAYEADGRRIINLTPGTCLDVFEKDDYRKWMPSPA